MGEESQPRVHQYALAEKLGESATGEVWQAWDTAMERIVVLRLLPLELSQNRAFRAQALTALRSLTDMAHENLITAYGATDLDKRLVIVTEYLPFSTMATLTRSGPIDNQRFLKLAIQIARGINHAHHQGVMHGNLRPGNIYVTASGLVKLADFGQSTLPVERRDPDFKPIARHLLYRSPEEITGEEVTPLSDLFSMGVVFWEMLAGQPLFMAETAAEIEEKVLTLEPDFDSLKTQYALPGDTVLLLRKLLAKFPGERLNSSYELQITLEAMESFEVESRNREFFQVRPTTPRQYLMLSMLAALLIIFWLVITTIKH